ncbi:MAG: hypothetical protein ACRD50_16535 [Candidatus Acidiferrales bacterium]
MNSLSSIESASPRRSLFGRMLGWLDAMPHPAAVCEITSTHLAVSRWGGSEGDLENFSIESLPEGAVVPSPIEPNIADAGIIGGALRRVLARVPGAGPEIALLIPDPVVRVFVLPFETFPRRAEEAVPLLRWRLKKSVPFDVEETVVSFVRQRGAGDGLEIAAALGRQRILREYESVVEAAGLVPGVVQSSSLAALSLLEERGATLFVRLSGAFLTSVIVRGSNLCVHRSSQMSASAATLEPQAVLDEIFPTVAYYQDTWSGTIDRVCLAGFAEREEVFRRTLGREIGCEVIALATLAEHRGLSKDVRSLVEHELEGMVGWSLNRGA